MKTAIHKHSPPQRLGTSDRESGQRAWREAPCEIERVQFYLNASAEESSRAPSNNVSDWLNLNFLICITMGHF